MPILSVYVSDTDYERLRIFSEESGRDVSELAESAVSEAAIQAVPRIAGRYMNPAHQEIADRLSKEA